ncbi:helix-turn-helix domain-containing protein [Nocardia asiatica]|uniref:helix-turn-helix domain-containing protein n=1 Tax=Nocardia asiatica TaxID=209252 RepID=UPI002455479A|nr:helix-turn-helix transcriptional regulator [Nocardia asiatica]
MAQPARRGELNWALSREVADRRKQLRLSQKEVARRAGLRPNVFQRLEYDERAMSVEQMDAVATALETTGDELFAAAKKRVKDGVYPTFAERAAFKLDAAIGYRRKT